MQLSSSGADLLNQCAFLAPEDIPVELLNSGVQYLPESLAAVAIDVNNLGGVPQALGDMEGAKKMYKRALAIGEATYGPDHPDVALVVNNLGNVLQALGDPEGAKKIFEQALRIFTKYLGEDHPDTVTVQNNLDSLS
jgi:tetratricopeptide (TPR) repeat protein